MADNKNQVNKSTLYLVGTPIGNLSDITERAKKVLTEVDFIAAEDTRVSLKLLNCYGIKKELVSYFEHNKKASGDRIIARLLSGESCALITDCGMPAISDPGEDIVRLCAENGITVSVIPGPCAAVSALAASGLPTRKFTFEGFLPAKTNEKTKELEALSSEWRTMIYYEAPHKLLSTLSAMKKVFGGERKISLAREITKINEEFIRTTLEEAEALFTEKEPRGEFVLIVEGKENTGCDESLLSISIPEHIELYISKGHDKREAIKLVAKDRGVSKSEIYKYTVND